jgi:hypothetical protein
LHCVSWIEIWGIDRWISVVACCFLSGGGDEALLSHYAVKSLDNSFFREHLIQKQVESRKVHNTIRTEAENVPCTE